MSVSRFLLLLFALLLAVTGARAMWNRPQTDSGKTELIWVSGSNPARQAQIVAFNNEHPNLNLTLDIGDAGTQKIILQCSSGVGPDIFDVYDGEQLETYVQAGVVWDITDQAKQGGFSAEENIWPSARQEVTHEGRQYSYPCNLSANILLYNKNVFDHFQAPYPEGLMTWEEFMALAQKVNAPAATGQESIYAVTGLNWQVFFESLGGQFFAEDGRAVIAESAELKRAFEMHREYVFEQRLMPTALELRTMSGQGGWGSGSLNQFASGRFAMIVTGEWAVIGLARTLVKQVRQLEASGKTVADLDDPLERPLRLGCVLVPKFADLPPSYRTRSRSAAINVASPRREEALAFLKYLSGSTYSEMINRNTDSLPGNPIYAELGIEPGPPELVRLDMHESTKEALRHGYTPRRSPYISTLDVMTVLRKQLSRLETDPRTPVDDLLRAAQSELDRLVQRNLTRRPDQRERFTAPAP